MPAAIASPIVLSSAYGTSSTSGTSSASTKPIDLGPGDLSLPELMAWLTTTIQKSDNGIRMQMADINNKKDYAAKLGEVIAALTKADNIKKDSDSGRDTSGLPNLTDYADQQWFKDLPPDAQKAYKWVADDTGSDGVADVGAVKAALSALSGFVGTLTAQNDTAMIRLQSAISSRSQAIQLVSNMLNTMNETAKATVGNIR